MNEKTDDPICALAASEKTLLSEYLEISRLFSKPFIFATWWCKPLIFNFKYLNKQKKTKRL